MATKSTRTTKEVPAIRVTQWLRSWDAVKFDPGARQSKPAPDFFVFAMPAAQLKALTGIYRRSAKSGTPRAKDPNVQRAYDEDRSAKIRDFVSYGFPWCELNEQKRRSEEFGDLKKPGWLPTAIVVNIIPAGEMRDGKKLALDDAVEIDGGGASVTLKLPKSFTGASWRSASISPLEVIDGQHRLWALEDFDAEGTFEMPVVAFCGLDRSWQAYLFWSINITPKRIKQSLAFDLYPLLRTEEWLERFEGHSIYRETRAQELVEALWSHPESPWYQRVNMLGEAGVKGPTVSQAAWIRSLMATFIKSWEGKGKAAGIGGLFGAPTKSHDTVLPWSRAQQAAFVIAGGQALQQAVERSKAAWAKNLREVEPQTLFDEEDDPAFHGPYSLLSTDQGIRGFLAVTNDVFFVLAEDLDLNAWRGTAGVPATDEEAVARELKSLKKHSFAATFDEIAGHIADYDWRTSSTPGLSDNQRKRQGVYRGSSGYKELRADVLKHLSSAKGRIGKAATQVAAALGY